jgi:hypothetical protein
MVDNLDGQPCLNFPVSGCGYETRQSLPMLRSAELAEDWKIRRSRVGVLLEASQLARLY